MSEANVPVALPQDELASDAFIVSIGGASVRLSKTNKPGVGTISLASLRDQILMEIRAGARKTITEAELEASMERMRECLAEDAREARDAGFKED